jgi:hypothetical protein
MLAAMTSATEDCRVLVLTVFSIEVKGVRFLYIVLGNTLAKARKKRTFCGCSANCITPHFAATVGGLSGPACPGRQSRFVESR